MVVLLLSLACLSVVAGSVRMCGWCRGWSGLPMWYVWVVLWSPRAGDDYDGRDHRLECERCMNAVWASSQQQWLVSRSRWLPAGGHVGGYGVVEGHGRSGHGTSSASTGGLADSCGEWLWLGVCGRKVVGSWIWAARTIGVWRGGGRGGGGVVVDGGDA